MRLVRDGVQVDLPDNIPLPAMIDPPGPWSAGSAISEILDHGRRVLVVMEAATPTARRRNAVGFIIDFSVADPTTAVETCRVFGRLLLNGWVSQLNGGPASWLGDGDANAGASAVGQARFFMVGRAE